MFDPSKFSVVNFVNLTGVLGVPFTQGLHGYVIPQARVLLKLDLAALVASPQSINIDVKNYQAARDAHKEIEIIQTQYFLKKDAYSMIVNKSLTTLLSCNVNEVLHLQSEVPLFANTTTQAQVKESTIGQFNITCSGASLSKNRDVLAVGDFTGNVKLFSATEKTHVLNEVCIDGEQIRYLHFHDYHNDILLIGTIGGRVYVWNTKSS